jgi:hypothetical protein
MPMAPIRRTHSVVRAYGARLRDLMDQLRADPLSDAKSVALIAHIVNNRATAAQLLDMLDNPGLGNAC